MKIYVSFPNNVNIAHFNSKVRFKIVVLHILERSKSMDWFLYGIGLQTLISIQAAGRSIIFFWSIFSEG